MWLPLHTELSGGLSFPESAVFIKCLMILSFTTVITTVTMVLNYSHVVPQDI